MYEKLEEHDKRIIELEKVSKGNSSDIEKLQHTDTEQEQRIAKMESNYINLENTIMKENRETRQSYQAQTDRQWEFIEQVTGFKESESKRKHEFRMHKTNQVAGILLKILGGGGIIYILVQDWLLMK